MKKKESLKVSKKDLKKLNISKIGHTPSCKSYMVGGISLDNTPPKNKKIWKCSSDCPLNGID